MPFTPGRVHAVFNMGDASCIGEARRHAAMLAGNCALDETAAGRLAIIVTELGTNLFRHAKGGRLLLTCSANPAEVEVIAMDRGPGIADIAKSMGDGYSTGGTSGTGLGAVRRLSQDFDVHSAPGEGTVILARVRPDGIGADKSHPVRIGGIATTAPGETVCGDSWAVTSDGEAVTVTVADGLGHGLAAHQASQAAIAVSREYAAAQPSQVLAEAHGALRTTRGAALAVYRLDTRASAIDYCGAGNVIARVVSGVSDRTLLTQNGTAGLQVRRTETAKAEWSAHAIVVIHTDGIESRWVPQRLLPVLGRDPVLIAALLMRDHHRGRDDATVVVIARKE
jgi:anti-sigma regulatory factor (Ser/Thr protein kinase)